MLVLDELERRVATATLAASLQQAMGAEVEIPEWGEVRAEFDERLVAEPVREDPRRLVLLRGLGLR